MWTGLSLLHPLPGPWLRLPVPATDPLSEQHEVKVEKREWARKKKKKERGKKNRSNTRMFQKARLKRSFNKSLVAQVDLETLPRHTQSLGIKMSQVRRDRFVTNGATRVIINHQSARISQSGFH